MASLRVLPLRPHLAQLESIWTPKDRIGIIRSVAPWWKEIGILLKVSEATLDVIHANNEDLPSRCRIMFQCWLEGASVKPVSWATLLEALQDCGFYVLAQDVWDALSTQFLFPAIHGANVLSQTKIEISPGQPLTYQWERFGFKVDIPAGAITTESGCGPVTMSIQASLSGEYQLPDDRVFVSGVYWIALSPPVKLAEKATISIQHCASEKDDTLSFITAKCTQKNLPYQFKELPGGSFSEPGVGSIQVDHFSAFAISGREKYSYAIHTYYVPRQLSIWEAHITVTPNLEIFLHVVKEYFAKAERGPEVLAKFDGCEILLNIPKVGVPEHTSWVTNGWELSSLVLPRLQKLTVDEFTGETLIPSFLIQMELINQSEPQSLAQRVNFEGLEPPHPHITLAREPELQGSTTHAPTKMKDATTGVSPSMSELLRLKIPGEVGAQYYKFGVYLLNDLTGSRMLNIEDECCGNKERIMMRILQEWLEGKGLPLKWQSLIQTLRDTELSVMADKIEAKQ